MTQKKRKRENECMCKPREQTNKKLTTGTNKNKRDLKNLIKRKFRIKMTRINKNEIPSDYKGKTSKLIFQFSRLC